MDQAADAMSLQRSALSTNPFHVKQPVDQHATYGYGDNPLARSSRCAERAGSEQASVLHQEVGDSSPQPTLLESQTFP